MGAMREAQRRTRGLAFAALRSSETTFVSRRNIREVGRPVEAGQARRLELDVRSFGSGEQIDDTVVFAGDFAVLLDGEQYVRGAAAVGDEDGAFDGGLFGATDVLIEFAAGDGGDGHGSAPM